MFKISILTSIFNSASQIDNLIQSLISQTSNDFEWIVSDGASTDKTLEIINSYEYNFPVKISSRKDFGIYDSLNLGLTFVDSDYYLVLGSDDILFEQAIENISLYLTNNNSKSDIYSMSIFVGDKLVKPRYRPVWLYGMRGLCSSHSVGLLIRKNLHDEIGLYSNQYSLCADQYLILLAYIKGYKFEHISSIVSGRYSLNGSSSVDIIGTLSENYRIQLKLFGKPFLQTVIYFLRLFKNLI